MRVRLGVQGLVDGSDETGMASDKDAVWVIQEAFHESMHVWQYSVGYRRFDASDRVKNAAKCYVIQSFMDEYYLSSYINNTSELLADQYAVSQTKRFFSVMSQKDRRFAEIDVDSILCMNEQRRRGDTYPRLKTMKNVGELVSVYSEMIDRSVFQKKFPVYQLKRDIPEERWSKGFREILQNEKLCDSIINSSSGLEETELLCHYIGEYHPEHFRGLLCIRDEYCHGIGSKTMSKLLRVTEAEPVEPGPDGPEIL